jgi:DNA primase
MGSFIPEDKIAEIKNRADIVDIVSELVQLKTAGRNYLGLCPFHSEKTPSFTVSAEKQIFYCFGCGAGGNAFSFLMKMDGLSFPEAARRLAKRYGIDIPVKTLSADQKRRLSERETLFSVNRAAMDFFHQTLLRDAASEKAREYLKRRQIPDQIIEEFHLGYAPVGWDHLSRYFSQSRVSLALVEKVGLIITRRNRSGYYDRFRERIIFPIFDLSMQVIGFGGRVIDDASPKYLNSPESPIYNKSRSLYGLHRAKQPCRNTATAYIVEGYFDLLRLHVNGIENSVATLGTALTEDHIRILKGYAERIVLVFDSDAAGIRAAHRSIDIFMKEEMDVRVMVLPSGYDPDSFLSEYGHEAFRKASENALGIIPFLIESAVETHGLSIEGKIRILNDMIQPLISIRDRVAASLYIKSLSERIGVDESAIIEKVRQTMGRTQTKTSGVLRGAQKQRTSQKTAPGTKGVRFEQHIIAMMLQCPEMIPEIEHRGLLAYFEDPALKSIGQMIIKHQQKMVSEIINLIEDKSVQCIAAGLAIGEDVWDREGCLKLMDQFEKSRNRRNNNLLEKIKSAEKNKDDVLLLKLLKQKQIEVAPS